MRRGGVALADTAADVHAAVGGETHVETNPLTGLGDGEPAPRVIHTFLTVSYHEIFRKGLHMAIAERTASTSWQGSLARGNGTVQPDSGAFDPLPVTWAARTEASGGKTSPEELAAAAHAACFAMALSLRLGERKADPQQLAVASTVTLDEVDGKPTVVSSALTVRAAAAGIDAAGFQAAVDEAAALCPISRLFAGAKITVDATLE